MTRRTGRLHACRSGGGLFPATVLGTSEARAHVTRLRCGTLQSMAPGVCCGTYPRTGTRSECGLKQNEICELGMIVDTSQENSQDPWRVSD